MKTDRNDSSNKEILFIDCFIYCKHNTSSSHQPSQVDTGSVIIPSFRKKRGQERLFEQFARGREGFEAKSAGSRVHGFNSYTPLPRLTTNYNHTGYLVWELAVHFKMDCEVF